MNRGALVYKVKVKVMLGDFTRVACLYLIGELCLITGCAGACLRQVSITA
jgi:hypothetical protein